VDEQLRRLARDTSRPLLRADDRTATLRAMAEVRTPLYRALAYLSLDTDSLTDFQLMDTWVWRGIPCPPAPLSAPKPVEGGA
jgi:shikimate kinase